MFSLYISFPAYLKRDMQHGGHGMCEGGGALGLTSPEYSVAKYLWPLQNVAQLSSVMLVPDAYDESASARPMATSVQQPMNE